MNTVSPPIQELIRRYRKYLEDEGPNDEVKIQVDEIASKVAAFYEKVRGVIDYQEGHLLRKAVISRALQRRIFLKDLSGKDIAEPLIKEVIRSGHLGNNSVQESKILEVQRAVDLILLLLQKIQSSSYKSGNKTTEWFLGVGVCAIEEILIAPEKERMLGEAVFRIVSENLKINGAQVSENDKRILLFIAIQKSLFKVDEDRLNYRLLKFIYPNWNDLGPEGADGFGREIFYVRSSVLRYVKHQLLPLFLRLCNGQRAVFYVLGDLIFGAKDLTNFEEAAQEVYNERYSREKVRLFKLAFLSVISFFLSKILVALAVEIPIDLYFLGHFSIIHVAANVVFPPFLMFFIVLAVKMPSEKNLRLVVDGVEKVIFKDQNLSYTINMPKKRNDLVRFFVELAYALIFTALLYYFAGFLLRLGFSAANVLVFTLFTSLVTATGVKVYNRAKELSLERERARFWVFVLDIVTLPLVTVGRWVMTGLKRFNILVLIFNLIIELPFQLFVEFLENFSSFVRAKKDEIE